MTDPKPQENGDVALDRLLNILKEASVDPTKDESNTDDAGDDPFADTSAGVIKFEGAEHRSIGDSCYLSLQDGKKVDAGTFVIQQIGLFRVDLTFGRVISMAGDFYTNRTPIIQRKLLPDTYDYTPISGAYTNLPKDTAYSRFADMVEAIKTNDWNYVKPVKDALDKEKDVVDQGMGADGGSAARVYHKGEGMDGDKTFTAMTSLAYPKISWLNADHFVGTLFSGPSLLICR